LGVTQIWMDQALNDSLRRLGVGGLEMTVRQLSAPTVTLETTRIAIYDARGERVRDTVAGPGGLLGPLQLEAGEYRVRALRIGFIPTSFRLPVDAGCTSTAELFLEQAWFGLDESSMIAIEPYRPPRWQFWRTRRDSVYWRPVRAGDNRRVTPTSQTVILRPPKSRATVTRCRPER
jgi:hypothetical protein